MVLKQVSILGLVDKGLRLPQYAWLLIHHLRFQSLVQWIKDLDKTKESDISEQVMFQSLVQWIKDLDDIYNMSLRFPIAVSILGLVDKGLRQLYRFMVFKFYIVSILGLVDKGLRHHHLLLFVPAKLRFNPWFSG